MKTTIRFILGALAVAAPAWLVVSAADSGPAPATGRVLVLENERTLEGDIERQGNQYRVRRAVGETWVPGEQVLRLCADWDAAYQFLRGRANLRDPDERLRLARWCHLHGLREQALKEISAAVELRPSNVESQRLLRSLQRTATTTLTQAVKPHEDAEQGPAAPPVELTSESMTMFANKVQPILMNTCASCHVSSKGGTFKLMRAVEQGVVSRRATQQNLAAVLAQVNVERWQASPLLIKAVSVHGDAGQPPLKNKQAATYRTLEEWVQLAVANNPQLADHAVPVAASGSVPEARTVAEFPTKKAENVPLEPPAPRPTPPIKPGAGPANEIPATLPAPMEPADAFDPLIFNRQMHPQK